MMTTLQIVLAIVGVSLIAIIVIYNVLQERKFRKEADRMFSHNRDEIMLGEAVRGETDKPRSEARIELSDSLARATEIPPAEAADAPIKLEREPAPVSILSSLEPLPPRVTEADDGFPAAARGGALPPFPPREASPPTASRPVAPTPRAMSAEGDEGAGTEEVAATTVQPSGLDPTTEYIARLKFTKPQLANFTALLSTLRRIGKPVRAFAVRADGLWELLVGHPRTTYETVEFGLQLVDRSGALSQDQLEAFCRALYEFAAEEGGAVSCPDREGALAKARDLDLFCMNVDVLIGLNIVSAESRPFTSEAMHSLAQEARLSLEPDGTFQARDDFGHTLFSLANQEENPFPRDGRGLTTHGVTLLFDVPRVADGIAAFDRMTRLGFDLAWRLEGRLVDDNGRPVSEESLGRDRERLNQFYERMEARGIPAGGERALRLFV